MSRFQIVDSLDRDQWKFFVDTHPKGSVFHTPQMYEVFRTARRHRVWLRAALNSQREIIALVTAVVVQTLPDPLGRLSSRSIFYAEPLCCDSPEGAEALAALVAEHDRELGARVLFTEVRPLFPAGKERKALEQSGYVYQDYLNYLIDLRQSREELWASLTGAARSNIRRGQKQGVRVEEMTTPEGVTILYRSLVENYARAQVPLADKDLFNRSVQLLQADNMVKVFIGYFDGQPIGGSIVLLYKDREYEWYWGALRLKGVYPSECITWHRIEWGQQHGYAVYDFGGAGWPDKPYGVRDFKAKFGPKLVNYGRYRKVYSTLKFALAEKSYESFRKMVNPRKWKMTE